MYPTWCLLEETLKAIGPFYLVSMPGEVKYPTRGVKMCMGPFKCYVTQMGVGGVRFYRKKRYEGLMCNVISVMRGWVGVQFPEN